LVILLVVLKNSALGNYSPDLKKFIGKRINYRRFCPADSPYGGTLDIHESMVYY
jgi:hypothetical protein